MKKLYKEISKCRIEKDDDLVHIMSLGVQNLTGVFPKTIDEEVGKGPLDLVWSKKSGLLQLKQTYDLDLMYGDNYGYRSGLNKSMVKHLERKVSFLENKLKLHKESIVLDIGSNDGTTLNCYNSNCIKIGMDPSAGKFKEYYNPGIKLIEDFFNAKSVKKIIGNNKIDIISSIAMFYDLEDPNYFVAQIEEVLSDEGIWHFEQSYMPSMLRTCSYDTLCHEHLEFYSLKVVKDLLEKNNLKIIDVSLNDINGGSFAVTAAKINSSYKENKAIINLLLREEDELKLSTIEPYEKFRIESEKHRIKLKDFLVDLKNNGKKVFGYGASTKGNVLLQYCGIDSDLLPYIAEVNEDKFGSFTPGTKIPIISEYEAKKMNPDYFLVLPWHFKNMILEKEKELLDKGVKFIFPLPYIQVV